MSFKEVYESDDVMLNVMTIPAGYCVGKHVHPYSHMSVLLSGEVEVTVSGLEPKIYKDNAFVEIEAHKSHVIRAISDSKWMCIHSKKEMDDSNQLHLLRA